MGYCQENQCAAESFKLTGRPKKQLPKNRREMIIEEQSAPERYENYHVEEEDDFQWQLAIAYNLIVLAHRSPPAEYGEKSTTMFALHI